MRTDHRWRALLVALGTAAALARPVPLAAQDALNRVGPKTQVRSVEFQFRGPSSLDEEPRKTQVRTKVSTSPDFTPLESSMTWAIAMLRTDGQISKASTARLGSPPMRIGQPAY